MIDNLIPDVVLEKRQAVQLSRTKLAGDLCRLTSRLFDPSSMSKSFAVSFSLHFTFEVDETESGMERINWLICFNMRHRRPGVT